MTFALEQEKNEGLWKDDQFVEKRAVPHLLLANEDQYSQFKANAPKDIVAFDLMRAFSTPEHHINFEAKFN